jgi:hypothetical protein
VGVDGVSGGPPSLDLLGNALRVGRGKNADFGGGAESGGKIVEQVGDGVGQAGGSEDAGAKEWVAREGVEKRVVGAFDIGVNPLEVSELFNGERADRSFLALSDPFQRYMVGGRVKGKRR